VATRAGQKHAASDTNTSSATMDVSVTISREPDFTSTLSSSLPTPQAPPIPIAVADFDYFDTSGEPTNQKAEHQARLQAFAAAGADVLADHDELRFVVLERGRVERQVVVGLVVLVRNLFRVAVPVLELLLVRRDQLGEHPGEGVDLVAAQLGTRSEAGRFPGEHAL